MANIYGYGTVAHQAASPAANVLVQKKARLDEIAGQLDTIAGLIGNAKSTNPDSAKIHAALQEVLGGLNEFNTESNSNIKLFADSLMTRCMLLINQATQKGLINEPTSQAGNALSPGPVAVQPSGDGTIPPPAPDPASAPEPAPPPTPEPAPAPPVPPAPQAPSTTITGYQLVPAFDRLKDDKGAYKDKHNPEQAILNVQLSGVPSGTQVEIAIFDTSGAKVSLAVDRQPDTASTSEKSSVAVEGKSVVTLRVSKELAAQLKAGGYKIALVQPDGSQASSSALEIAANVKFSPGSPQIAGPAPAPEMIKVGPIALTVVGQSTQAIAIPVREGKGVQIPITTPAGIKNVNDYQFALVKRTGDRTTETIVIAKANTEGKFEIILTPEAVRANSTLDSGQYLIVVARPIQGKKGSIYRAPVAVTVQPQPAAVMPEPEVQTDDAPKVDTPPTTSYLLEPGKEDSKKRFDHLV